jgi:hypothetical protein
MSPIFALAFAFAAIIVVGAVSAWLHDVLAARFGAIEATPRDRTRPLAAPWARATGAGPTSSARTRDTAWRPAPRRPLRPADSTTAPRRRNATDPWTTPRPPRPIGVRARPLG